MYQTLFKCFPEMGSLIPQKILKSRMIIPILHIKREVKKLVQGENARK